MYFENSQGAEQYLAAASAPIGTVVKGEDQGIPNTSTAAFTGATATFIDITVAQFNGAAAEWDAVYVVFNSADPATELADATARFMLNVQGGIGETRRFVFPKETLASMHYKSIDASANMVIRWEYK